MKTLDDLRAEIDRIDSNMARLFTERMDCVRVISDCKTASCGSILNPEREMRVIDAFVNNAAPPLHSYATAFAKNMIRISREYQYSLQNERLNISAHAPKSVETAAYPGISGSHSGIAASYMYPNAKSIPCDSFDSVFEAVSNGSADVGVLPLDNSTAGTVGAVYDLLIHYNLSIVRADTRRIRHCLVGLRDANAQYVTHVYSHPQALAQCSGYLKAHNILPLQEVNTAVAAKRILALSDPTVAAVASHETAQLYGLKILDSDINDNSCNQTRFICIARELENAENANRISVAFNLPNECGALSALLATLADSGVSLSKIMSRPIPDTPWEYIFYADLEGNLENAALRGVLYQLRCETPSLILLGVYPESGAAQ